LSAATPRPFPLVPRRRFAGEQFGRRRSSRRGDGDEIVGTRPYRPGDRIAWIHWAASARLSAARGTDEFVVREYFAEQAPRVAVVRDPSPTLAINAPPSPWLDKRSAVESVVRLIAASAAAEQGELVYVDSGRAPRLLRPPDGPALTQALATRPQDAGASLVAALSSLGRDSAMLPTGSFVFVISDFLVQVPARTLARLRSLGWDVTPVVVQDPVWEQAFPQAGGVVLPLLDGSTGEAHDVWLTPGEARERGRANERRLAELLVRFRRLGFDPVVVGSTEAGAVRRPFVTWAERRRRARRVAG
jgi:uncharacterized protein (DUF58 family)